ncbi:MAG: hypothetical protein U0871_06670 [Gemmataceae bacterium]
MNRTTFSTSGTGKTAKSHRAGSNGGTSPACSTGHLCVCAWPGGSRCGRRVSGLRTTSSAMTRSETAR